ncbi:MAG: aminotransferase class I/II-fold pyridoxal phosphate-dependent enzyme, partial [Deltaproteobacteria bacterium]
MTMQLDIDPHVDSIVMPENLKVGLIVSEAKKKCAEQNRICDYAGFALGQSPFPVPGPLEKALASNADKGHYSVADGIPELRKAIANFMKRHFGVHVTPSRVVVGPGTKSLIFTVFTMINGHVIIPSPSWIGYTPQIKLLGKHFHILYTRPEHNYRIQPQDLEDLLVRLALENKQHLLVLNNPHNPTGIVYSREELIEIVEVCRRNNAFILADEIYALSTYRFEEFTSLASLFPEGAFVLNGLSKDRSAGGYRLGACILPQYHSKKLKLDFMKIAATVYTNVSTPTQYAAVAAYEPNEEIEEYFRITRDIHRIMGQFSSDQVNNMDGIRATVPQGAFYLFADFNRLAKDLKRKNIMTSNQLETSLMAHPHHVATITGDSLLLRPDDYGARLAFVDYDGKAAYERYKMNPPKSPAEEREFVRE